MGKLNLDDVRASSKAIKADKGTGKFFKCQPGKNVVRLFTFESAPKGRTALERPIKRHYKLDSANPLCQKTVAPNGKAANSCEFCDRVEEIRAEEGDKVAKRVEANKKFVINVVPVQVGGTPVQGPPKMTQFDAPTSVLETVLAVMEDSGDPSAFCGFNGLDLAINYDPKADPKRMYTAMFRAEAASKPTSAVLAKHKDALAKAIVDLDSDPHLLPEWWKQENGIEDAAPSKGASGKGAEEEPRPDEDAAADADGAAPADEQPAFDTEGDGGQGDQPDEPAAEPGEPEANEPEPEYKGTLPKGVTAFWSERRKKFFFKMPNGETTWDEAAAKKAAGPAKPAASGKAAAAKPAAAKPAAKPAATKKGR